MNFEVFFSGESTRPPEELQIAHMNYTTLEQHLANREFDLFELYIMYTAESHNFRRASILKRLRRAIRVEMTRALEEHLISVSDAAIED